MASKNINHKTYVIINKVFYIHVCIDIYKFERIVNDLGLEDFELKIDQIAAAESGLSISPWTSIDEDADWITSLYRKFNTQSLSSFQDTDGISDALQLQKRYIMYKICYFDLFHDYDDTFF